MLKNSKYFDARTPCLIQSDLFWVLKGGDYNSGVPFDDHYLQILMLHFNHEQLDPLWFLKENKI